MFLRHSANENPTHRHNTDTHDRYTVKPTYSQKLNARRSNRDWGFLAGFTGIFILSLLITLTVVGLSIWAIVFGFTDNANNGVNPWAVFWIVAGIISLYLIFRNK